MLNVDSTQMNGVRTVRLPEDLDQTNKNVPAKPGTLRNAVVNYPMTYAWVTGPVSSFIHPMRCSIILV